VVSPPSPDVRSVSRIEFENIEAVVRANADKLRVVTEKLDRLQKRADGLAREIAELTSAVRALTIRRE
jgi:hypothetical protein